MSGRSASDGKNKHAGEELDHGRQEKTDEKVGRRQKRYDSGESSLEIWYSRDPTWHSRQFFSFALLQLFSLRKRETDRQTEGERQRERQRQTERERDIDRQTTRKDAQSAGRTWPE